MLSKLHDKRIEMVAEDKLDNEVEQGDIIKEETGLCIMDTELAHECASSCISSSKDHVLDLALNHLQCVVNSVNS